LLLVVVDLVQRLALARLVRHQPLMRHPAPEAAVADRLVRRLLARMAVLVAAQDRTMRLLLAVLVLLDKATTAARILSRSMLDLVVAVPVLLEWHQAAQIAQRRVVLQATVVQVPRSRRIARRMPAAAVAATSTAQASLAPAELVAAVTANAARFLLPAMALSILAVAAVADSTPAATAEAES
jgi:hypothetical protein